MIGRVGLVTAQIVRHDKVSTRVSEPIKGH